jgi:hypothetical protein
MPSPCKPRRLQCGTACCRGSVTGQDWMRTDVQSRYAGRFTPCSTRGSRHCRRRSKAGRRKQTHLIGAVVGLTEPNSAVVHIGGCRDIHGQPVPAGRQQRRGRPHRRAVHPPADQQAHRTAAGLRPCGRPGRLDHAAGPGALPPAHPPADRAGVRAGAAADLRLPHPAGRGRVRAGAHPARGAAAHPRVRCPARTAANPGPPDPRPLPEAPAKPSGETCLAG